MTATPTISVGAKRRISRFMLATENLAFLGASHPDDWPAIEQEYAAAKKSLYTYIAKLEANQK